MCRPCCGELWPYIDRLNGFRSGRLFDVFMNSISMMAETTNAAVLLVAHGSRVRQSNSEVESLAARLAERLAPNTMVSYAFLEPALPSIPDAIDSLARQGIQRIVLIPYFLSAGRHVSEDIPGLVAEAREKYPDSSIEITEHFGAVGDVPELLSAMVSRVHAS
ncbi:MAG: Sirohydrochlorin cobaltochelatase [Gammaproteobacteria bacterium]|nr:Sirohydrochlorin cobaltochelatase [Gammaproteobacteria bacterium]